MRLPVYFAYSFGFFSFPVLCIWKYGGNVFIHVVSADEFNKVWVKEFPMAPRDYFITSKWVCFLLKGVGEITCHDELLFSGPNYIF